MLAITAEPMLPPMVRMFAFMPLATPVWDGGTAATTSADIAAKASPKPTPWMRVGQVDLPLVLVREGQDGHREAPIRQPVTTSTLPPSRGQPARRTSR